MEASSQPALTSAYYLSVIRRRRRIVIAGALIGALLGIAYIATRPGGYSSSASVVVRQVVTDPRTTSPTRGVSSQTEASVMASTVVAQRAADVVGRDVDPDDMLKRLTVDTPQDELLVNSPQDTLVLNAAFQASTPERAREGAQAFADAYLDYRQGQYDESKARTLATIDNELTVLRRGLAAAQTEANRLAAANPNSVEAVAARQQVELLAPRILDAEQARSAVDAVDTNAGEVIKPARLPTGSAGVSSAIAIIATTALGAIIGVVIALVRQRTDPYLRSRQDFTEVFNRPPLAEIRRRRRNASRRAAALTSPDASEFRHLRVRLWPSRPLRFQRVLMTDVSNADTTARIVRGVARSLAGAHLRVLVIWPDQSETDFDAQRLEKVEGVRLLPWSAVEGYSGDAIDPTALKKVLDEASEMDDVVLLTGTPILSTAEGPELYSLVDGVVVSFDPAAVRTDTLESALDEVGTMGGELAGVVVSPVPRQW